MRTLGIFHLALVFAAAPAAARLFGRKPKADPFAAANEAKANELQGKKGLHEPVGKGLCSSCHADPKEPSKFLKQGQLLCFSCHEDRAADLKKASVHAPYKDMGCETCHLPHASDNPALLNAPTAELCSNCHDASDGAAKAAHFGITKFSGSCMACHSPHASTKPKLIIEAAEHVPFGSRSCEMCHAETGAGGAAGLKPTPEATCFVCHSNFRKLDKNPVVHAPAAGGECAACHNPHVSRRGALIKGPLAEICFQCHDASIKGNHPLSRHPESRENTADPRRKGKPFNCASCHRPHAGEFPKLMRADFHQLCSECHKK